MRSFDALHGAPSRESRRLGRSRGSLVRFSFRVRKTTIRRRPRFPISSSSDRPTTNRPSSLVGGNVANLGVSWRGSALTHFAPREDGWSRGVVDGSREAYLDRQESFSQRRRRKANAAHRLRGRSLSNQLLIQYSFLRDITFHLHALCPIPRSTFRAFRNLPRLFDERAVLPASRSRGR